jgi:PPM family protein phosphatase
MTSGPRDGAAPVGEVIVHVYGRSDVGRAREHNEDAFAVADLTTGTVTLAPESHTYKVGERGLLFMVADGMGGAAAGELASAMAVDVVLDELRARWASAREHDGNTFATRLRASTETANTRIHRFAADHPEHRGMGTTATIAGLLGDTIYVAQVGDSRAYIVRDGVARQITKDQSLMQKLIEAGEITAEEAELSERKNIILQALGPEPMVRADLTHQHVRRGDTLVLCSDGLSGQIRIDDIARAITEERSLDAACTRLIDLANANGGPDNITVVAARFEGEGLAPPTSRDAIGHAVYAFGGDVTPHMPIGRFMPTPAAASASSNHATPPGAEMPRADTAAAVAAGRRSNLLLTLGLVALIALVVLAAYKYIVVD